MTDSLRRLTTMDQPTHAADFVNLPFFIDELSRADVYPHPTEVITTIETHISVVFLTGDYAYKLKKPVDFGFLDFSQLADRKRYCELEIQLNQRSAPELYIDICPLYFHDGQVQFEPNGDPVEYLIKMKQFDPNRVLGRYLKEHTLDNRQIQELSERIAQFHASAEATIEQDDFGHPDNLIHPMLENFPPLLKSFPHPEQQYRLKQLAEWTHFTQKTLYDDLLARKADGFVRACHGDMHLDNITLLNDVPTLFDGIEFNEQFRWIDVMNDLAFLMIDLDNRQQVVLKRKLLSQYLSLTGDYNGLKFLRFYQVYRSMVRSKITALRYHQLPKGSFEAEQHFDLALQYLKQAEDDAYALPEPKLVLMVGVSGSGKSHYAQALLNHLDAIVISSDIERKRLYGIDPTHRVPESEKTRLYAPEMSRQTYQRLHQLAKTLLAEGYSVIVDATFLKSEHRQPFLALAVQAGCRAHQLYITPNNHLEMIRRNLHERQTADTSPSDADVAVMHRQLESLEPPSETNITLTLTPGAEIDEELLKNWLNPPL